MSLCAKLLYGVMVFENVWFKVKRLYGDIIRDN